MSEDEFARGMFDPVRVADEPAWNLDGAALVGAGRRKARVRTLALGTGATLSAVALIGGIALVPRSGGGGSSVSAVHRAPGFAVDPTMWEKYADLDLHMPALFNALLPDGPKLSWTKDDPAAHSVGMHTAGHGVLQLTGKDGVDIVSFSDTPNTLVCTPPAQPTGTPVTDRTSCTSAAVAGGTVHEFMNVAISGKVQSFSQFFYWFIPTDPKQRSFALFTDSSLNHPQITLQQFSTLATSPGFDKLVDLVDHTIPPTAPAVKLRADLDAKIAPIAEQMLPAGYSMRITRANLIGALELAGPDSVAGADWGAGKPALGPFTCDPGSKCSTKQTTVPGGRLEVTIADITGGGATEFREYYSFTPTGQTDAITLSLNDATSVPTLSADQFLAIAQAPGIAQTIAKLNSALQG